MTSKFIFDKVKKKVSQHVILSQRVVKKKDL